MLAKGFVTLMLLVAALAIVIWLVSPLFNEEGTATQPQPQPAKTPANPALLAYGLPLLGAAQFAWIPFAEVFAYPLLPVIIAVIARHVGSGTSALVVTQQNEAVGFYALLSLLCWLPLALGLAGSMSTFFVLAAAVGSGLAVERVYRGHNFRWRHLPALFT